MTSTRTLVAVLALTVTSAAQASTQIYDVDPTYRQEVYDVLHDMLNVDPDRFSNLWGKVQLLPNGQLVVDTLTDERQAQVAGVLEAIAKGKPDATPPVTLHYWALRGVPGGQDAPGLPAVLDSVIRELETVHGDLGIQILDAATVTGQSGQESSFDNDRWAIRQFANANASRLNAELEMRHGRQHVKLEVSLTRGQFLILGAGTTGGDDDPDDVQAFVVNWPQAD